MEVILMQDLVHTGKRGQVVNVKPGFARNYLLPQGLALEATPANRRHFEQLRKKIDARHTSERQAAEAVAAQLKGLRIELAKRASETNTLYGSVTATEIAEELARKGVQVDRRRIDLEGGIKTIGDHHVRLDLHSEVAAEILVTVVPEE